MERMEAEQVAMKQLDSGERLLWSGSPRPGGMALAALPLTFMGVVFTGFAAFWIASAMNVSSGSSGDGFPGAIFPLFGVPFLVIGFGMLLGPVWAYRSAKNTVYAVTDKRVLIITGTKTVGVRSFAPEDIGEIVRVEAQDGSGTLKFGIGTIGSPGMLVTAGAMSTANAMSARRSSRFAMGLFVGIPEVRRVEQLIRENLLLRAA
jgi:hypothetical protein